MDYKEPSYPPGFHGQPLRKIDIAKGPALQDSLISASRNSDSVAINRAQILEINIKKMTQVLVETGSATTPPSLLKAVADLTDAYQKAGIGVIRGDAPEDGTAEIITGKPLAQMFADAVRQHFQQTQL